jgi:hypothetical protein
MHLAELIRLRTRPGAGLLLALTQRCPLSCAHCSTNSTVDSPLYSGSPLRKLIGSFTPQERPELLFMSGGEPLLRPGLVTDLAIQAKSVGTRSSLLSGMFFAGRGLPPAIRRAISSLDHFSASIDVFHEREVDRADVFAVLGRILDIVPAVSLHIAAHDQSYLDDLLPQVRKTFGDRVPALVNRVQPRGRARSLSLTPAGAGVIPADPGPCEFASWPLVDYDGTIFACSRQSLVRAHRSRHLVLGHAARHTWAEIASRSRGNPVLRSVRLLGAIETARRTETKICGGVCETCVTLPTQAEVSAGVEAVAEHLLAAMRPRDLARRWGAGPYAELVELGWAPCAN